MNAKYIANMYMEIICALSGEDKRYAPDVEASKGGANANPTYFYTYLDAKYVKKCTSRRTLKINNPMGLLSWDPLASSYDYGGQNLIHSAYEAR